MGRHLTQDQIDFFHEQGYLALPNFFDAAALARVRAATDRVLDGARHLTATNHVLDLDARHTPESPVVNRIFNPPDQDPAYEWVMRDSPIGDVLCELWGTTSVKFHHSKVNVKGAVVGNAVDWHQDAPFHPHSNDDAGSVCMLLDDADATNGAMQVLPGSHRGEIYDHWDGQRFAGRMPDWAVAQIPMDRVHTLALPAGSIHIHNYRLVHGSAPNTSNRPRRLLINVYSAGDAIPLCPDRQASRFHGSMVRGDYPTHARCLTRRMKLPPRPTGKPASIYAHQHGAKAAE